MPFKGCKAVIFFYKKAEGVKNGCEKVVNPWKMRGVTIVYAALFKNQAKDWGISENEKCAVFTERAGLQGKSAGTFCGFSALFTRQIPLLEEKMKISTFQKAPNRKGEWLWI